MLTQFQKFKTLHEGPELFLLPNVWNPRSAIIFQENGFSAIGTSSAAVAESLGYDDGQQMPFQEYLLIVRRILASVQIPLTVDIEMGYGNTKEEIFSNLLQLIEAGVVGINIEDSIINNKDRSLDDAGRFAKKIEFIKSELERKRLELFINVRCDTYILNIPNKVRETRSRLKVYESAGADGIFLPTIKNEGDIIDAIENTALPLNVMCVPGLPGFGVLNRRGVKRVSMGPVLFRKVYERVGELSAAIINNQDFSILFSPELVTE